MVHGDLSHGLEDSCRSDWLLNVRMVQSYLCLSYTHVANLKVKKLMFLNTSGDMNISFLTFKLVATSRMPVPLALEI